MKLTPGNFAFGFLLVIALWVIFMYLPSMGVVLVHIGG